MIQLSLTTELVIPPDFAAAWEALERLHNIHRVVEVTAVVRVKGRLTVAVKAYGKTYAVLARSDVEAAARDLFHQVHGPFTQDSK